MFNEVSKTLTQPSTTTKKSSYKNNLIYKRYKLTTFQASLK
jgi:hypothetical protein